MSNAILIVAAGRGTRAGADIPKQYQAIGGKTLLSHAITAFASHPNVQHVQVVIHPDDGALYEDAVRGLALPALNSVMRPPAQGGASRQESVRLGLEALAGSHPKNVLIHDGARPFTGNAIIDRVLAKLNTVAGAIPALAVTDTLKRGGIGKREGNILIEGGVDRAGLWRAQTPQGFRFAEILAAHRKFAGKDLTDDAAVAEAAGLEVALVEGEEENFKVTTAIDLARAEKLLSSRLSDAPLSDIRVGSGFDVHAFAAEKTGPLMICGIEVPFDRSLLGHSDADVGLHAATDAILGALAEGDIGQHFPPNDPKWRGAPSDTFLRHAGALVAARGGVIGHLDVTIICERPKLAPHRAAMQSRIAEILGLKLSQISVKATTTEMLGFTGRGEGIAAQAIATLRLALA
jgi:2-C-methyl-D-erythritol 4-phosphate cytidylyltransferase/2-C-methyl-D-erythritol 2,4-cyclodiphosphate synthase